MNACNLRSLDCAMIRQKLRCNTWHAHAILAKYGKKCGRRRAILERDFERLLKVGLIS